MRISASDAILMAHATFGVLGILAALWAFVETLNVQPRNVERIRAAAWATSLCMVAAGIAGGYWYVRFYPTDRGLILQGPWPLAHSLFMETKEHLFFIVLILSLYLPIAARDALDTNVKARMMLLCVAMLIVLSGLAMEGSGALINHGAKLALERISAQAAP